MKTAGFPDSDLKNFANSKFLSGDTVTQSVGFFLLYQVIFGSVVSSSDAADDVSGLRRFKTYNNQNPSGQRATIRKVSMEAN